MIYIVIGWNSRAGHTATFMPATVRFYAEPAGPDKARAGVERHERNIQNTNKHTQPESEHPETCMRACVRAVVRTIRFVAVLVRCAALVCGPGPGIGQHNGF